MGFPEEGKICSLGHRTVATTHNLEQSKELLRVLALVISVCTIIIMSKSGEQQILIGIQFFYNLS